MIIAAALFWGGLSREARTFGAMLKNIGPALLVLNIMSLVIGVAYLIAAEVKKE